MSDAPLWTPPPDRIAAAAMTRFRDQLAQEHTELTGCDYASLHAWSLQHIENFWTAIWDFCGVIGERDGPVLSGDSMFGARFFPDSRLNFAENLLMRGDPEAPALRYRGEDGLKACLSRAQLRERVSRCAAAFQAAGLEPGDRVAAMLPNRSETVIAMLACTSLGGIWSSCSPDFGSGGVLDRFGQITPKLFLACADYRYAGKHFDTREKAAAVLQELPSVAQAFLLDDDADLERPLPGNDPRWRAWEALEQEAPDPGFTRLPFNHPLYILYSSGTTGAPKCIVHGAGGVLLQHLKEHQLHADIRPGDAVFYFTTCGWMMWNWLVSALASEACVLLYDGSPMHPSGEILFDYAEQADCSYFGVSAKFIDALKTAGLRPRNSHRLSALRSLASTGSPLVPESFAYAYEAIKPDMAVQSISGGTDIVACFALGNPWLPVYPGELQCAGLGMATDVWNEDGKPAAVGEKGDLVCTRPFPSQPLGFWNDPEDARYRDAYFSTFDDIWHHGDYAEKTAHGGLIIHGRSDATLNPGGVRIGTAEIYRQVEQIPSVIESLAVGQQWEGDVRIVLFVILCAGCVLDHALELDIRQRIRQGASPRHVPSKIIQVHDLPRTRSGKLAELAVRAVIDGGEVKNRNALANPESLAQFSELAELHTA